LSGCTLATLSVACAAAGLDSGAPTVALEFLRLPVRF
jgi:hypothetical protein